MSKQKATKTSASKSSSSSSKLTKAELEAIALEFREELNKVIQEQQNQRESTGQELEAVRTGLQQLEQTLKDFESRSNLNERQLQAVGEMAALAQQRLDKELAAVSERPWEAIREEVQNTIATGVQGVAELEASLRSQVSDLNALVENTVQRLVGLENQLVEQAAAAPVDREQEIIALGQRLDARLGGLEEAIGSGEGRLVGVEQTQALLMNKFQELEEVLSKHVQSHLPAQGAPSAAADEQATPVSGTGAAQSGKSAQDWLHKARLLWNGRSYTDPQTALDCLKQALEIEPENPELLNERGLALAGAGFPEKAIADFSRAILLDATLAASFHNRGLLYMKMDNKDLACRDFRSAAALGDSRALQMARETGYCGGSLFKKMFRGVID
ncbi:hypothetical protein [Desulfonatronum thioautotrophicum]|uniref:hypothetical protein n=1 Tax=Desulfonatronum thioautotrophicum TaxID=617001 RepID=UPI00069C73C6|nr:hypothetical protein [Desulfonatronum thioautotrophicum]